MTTRYATFPLDCDALKAANEAVLKAHPKELKGRKLSMSPDDYQYRKEWMDAYIAAGGKAQTNKPKRKLGDPLTTCQEPKQRETVPQQKTGTLVVTVVDESNNPIPEANVHITDKLIHVLTDGNGIAKIKDLEEKEYSVSAWKNEYSEEVKKTDKVRAKIETHCKIKLNQQMSGILPVFVFNQNNQPVENARVTATPPKGFRSPSSHETLKGKTDSLGSYHFEKMRYNTYELTAYKDGSMSETKNGIVSRPGMNDKVTLLIDLEKKWMSICISSARWYKASLPGKLPGPGILGIDVYFQIEDLERKKKALYFASYTQWGITWGAPWSSGHTLKAGEPRQFQVERNLNLNETSFGGDARSTVYSIGTQMFFDLEMAYRDLLRKVTVNNIKVGDSTFELPGVDRYSGMVQLVRQN